MALLRHGRAGEAIKLPSDQMPERMAGKGIERKQDDIRQHHQATNADKEVAVVLKCQHYVIPEKRQEHDRQIKTVAMQVLQDERKPGFALVAFPHCGLADRTRWWIGKKRAVIRLAVVVAGRAKTQRTAQNQN